MLKEMTRNEIAGTLEKINERTLDEYTVVQLWDCYCETNNYYDDKFYNMYMFDELMSGAKPSELLHDLESDFDINDEYFRFTIWGIESTSDLWDFIDINELYDFVRDNIDSIAYEYKIYEFIKE